jgi:formiminotetrahydrofolate cyclodeaminase
VSDRALSDLPVGEFLAALASDRPAPGGGAAAALAAATGAALIEMVCRFSQEREQYAPWAEQIAGTVQAAGRLRQDMQATMDADAAAFAAVAAAYGLPRDSKAARTQRRGEIDDALAAAAAPPLQVAAAAASLAEFAVALIGRTNAQLVSDLGAAGALLEAALRIATLNVTANTRALKTDPRAQALQQQLEATQATAATWLAELQAAVAQAVAGEGTT